jgi:hypothetical protein
MDPTAAGEQGAVIAAPRGAVQRHRAGPRGHDLIGGGAVLCAIAGVLALAFAGFQGMRSGPTAQASFVPGAILTDPNAPLPGEGPPSGAPTAIITAKVYGPAPTAELRLITCGGTFNSHRSSYDDDVVVCARESA